MSTRTVPLHRRASALSFTLLVAGAHVPVIAHEGEDHGPPADTLSRPVLPRAIAHSDSFELVGIVEAARLLIYLDAADTNAPVAGATVQVEGAGLEATAQEVEPGLYALPLAQALPPGSHPLTFSVQTANDADLLAAPLVVAEPEAQDDDHATGWGQGWGSLLAAGLVGAVLGMVAMAGIVARRRSATRTPT